MREAVSGAAVPRRRALAPRSTDRTREDRGVPRREHRRILDEHRRAAGSVGIDAIPAHIFGRRYLILGAQPREIFDQVLDRLGAEA